MRVAIFETCLVGTFYPRIRKATEELLRRLGCEVEYPASQTCCGQPAYNSGYREEALQMRSHLVRSFEGYDYVVSPSGSCVAMIKESPQAEPLAHRIYELGQFITQVLQVKDVGATLHATATYHTSCHLSRLLHVHDEPLQLLGHVKGLQMIPLPHKEICCGFGGTFCVKMVAISEKMVDEKIDCILETGAELLIGSDPSCLMQIAGRISRRKLPIRTLHIAEVLNAT